MHACPVSAFCKTCYAREWRKRHPERDKATRRRADVKRLYGLDRIGYDALLSRQDGKCGICRRPFSGTPDVDHDHATGKVRGLVHPHCNRMIAQGRHDPEVLRRGAEYLELHGEDSPADP